MLYYLSYYIRSFRPIFVRKISPFSIYALHNFWVNKIIDKIISSNFSYWLCMDVTNSSILSVWIVCSSPWVQNSRRFTSQFNIKRSVSYIIDPWGFIIFDMLGFSVELISSSFPPEYLSIFLEINSQSLLFYYILINR